MDLALLQIKSPELIRFYIISLCTVLIFGLAFFIFNKRFKKLVVAYITNHFFFVIIFTTFYLIYLIARVFFVDSIFPILFKEDGVFEYGTTIFFLMATLFFLLAFIKSKNSVNTYTKIFILSMALFCFVVGMEEISWGQRILGIDTPESYKEMNYQGETTVHNLISPKYHPLIYFIFSILCLIFFAYTNTRYESLLFINRMYLPQKKFLIIALLLPLIAIYNMEHFEVILSFTFCIYAYLLYTKGVESISVNN